MFDWFRKKEDDDEKYLLVKTLIQKITDAKIDGEVYFYLYESNKGNRKFEYKSTIPWFDDIIQLPTYCGVVYPWSKGVDFSDVLSYWNIVKEKQWKHIKEIYSCLPKK